MVWTIWPIFSVDLILPCGLWVPNYFFWYAALTDGCWSYGKRIGQVKAGSQRILYASTMSMTEICLSFSVNFKWIVCFSLMGRYCGCKINLFRIMYSVYIVLNGIYIVWFGLGKTEGENISQITVFYPNNQILLFQFYISTKGRYYLHYNYIVRNQYMYSNSQFPDIKGTTQLEWTYISLQNCLYFTKIK